MMGLSAMCVGWIPPLLAADVETWLKLTFAAVAFLIWAINQLVSNAKKQAPPQAPQPMQQQRPQPGLEDVQDFLRRATEQRQREVQKPPQPPKQRQPRPAQKKGPPQPPKKPKTIAKPLSAEVIDEPMRERSVGAHVQKHLDTKAFQVRSSHLSQVAEAPSQLESHQHQVFDHRVGRLTQGIESDDDPATEGPASALVPAAAIAKLLANPESAKQAFILGEIFRRPESTW